MQFIDFPEINFPVQGLDEVRIPRMVRVRQKFEDDRIEDPAGYLSKLLSEQNYSALVKGKSIAITVGSRGIPDNALMVKAMCDKLKEWGAFPFIVPSMGSHGAGCREGNLEVLEGYGVTEEAMGVPIKASMEVKLIGSIDDDAHTPIYCDKYAAEADGIIIYNKVKPHTDFKGEHESGLAKMITIGLAKHKGCSWFHMQGFDTFAERIPMVAEEFLRKMPVVFGVGVVQNAYDEISDIMVFPREKIMEGDALMLRIAKRRFPRFKFDNIDVLVIDRIGKDISGEGADPNVTGRGFMPYFKDDFHTTKLMIRGLTELSHHNACGLGLADITTRRCLNSVDWESTWINLTTNLMIDGGKVPMYQNSDFEALRLAIRTCPKIDYSKARIVRIRDTLSLSEFEISESLIPDVAGRDDVEILGEPYELEFDEEGYLKDFE
ncbi:MAG: DUF362 domain-containing protein [Lachnospiraceae bacterium]|nr:DUF362 domain-containing protein [Lachnospiraceae bacterium]